ncbi:EscV/YscV/HrcV family type III secretion system export apparatus protein [Roseomonas hellenica]|uniref:EscV/YscV/HrcV family type III secretion system export apparatus protein n=1 Tax=Plastoroseomonas hellenica TaxID=2687306 RepID=A0ABS5ERL3_9PROT|nr:type III secretion system export apparatus subunit SctV [Plastoroseomonas hellenica]MBR0662928.1 EscV/YscV/HrcV family type III secretion system export apparatus protein [Plastoroseomonas hellenica]
MLGRTLARLPFRSDLAVAALLLATVAMMVVPLPTIAVDALLTISISGAVLLLMVAFYLRTPVEFSTLPAVILVMTVFRLALSIATTRLVLLQADAGDIVRTFGEFVVGGNVVVGLVIFLIITVVQFVVITKGAERVAEVAARFTLDALPGKQMAIDADLRSGDIDQQEARRRRRGLERESQLYGAMDGAMKFVKGDAIAGLVIIVVNLIGGLAVGVMQHGMSIGAAGRTYAVLTVGDGLVAQIPALFVAITAGIVVTRVATAEADGTDSLGAEIVGQVMGDARALWLAAAAAALLGLVPGFPVVLFLALAAGFALLARRAGRAPAIALAKAEQEALAIVTPEVSRIRLLLSPGLAAALPRERLRDALAAAVNEAADALGVSVPTVLPIASNALEGERFRLEIDGVPVAEGVLPPDAVLLRDDPEHAELAGVALIRAEPLPGQQGFWASRADASRLAASGVGHAVPEQALAMCVAAVLRAQAAQFVGIQETRALLARLESEYGDLIRETLRVVPLQRIAEVLRRLLEEGIAVRNLRGLLESLLEHGEREQDVAALSEAVRAGLRRQICHRHADHNRIIAAFMMDADAEETIRSAVRTTPAGTFLALPEGVTAALAERLRMELAASRGPAPVMLCSLDIRRHVRTLLANNGADVAVISYQDLSPDFTVQPLGTIHLPGGMAARARGPQPERAVA